jgi:biuret amidohydrolase
VRSKCHRPKVRINNIINLKLTPDRGLPSRPPNFSIDGLTFEKKCSSNGASSGQGLFFKCAAASWFLEEWSEQAAKLFFQNMLQGVSIRFKLRVLRRNASKLPSGNLLVLACQFVCDTSVIYTAHVHRRDGSDMGLYDDLYEPIADRTCLVDETPGIEIYKDLAPAKGEHVIKKHRYSAFFGTDLDIILREWGITTVIVSGTTTENCCHATARDAMFRDYKVVFLSDATGTFDYPDVGQGAMSAADVHKATLTILAFSTAAVLTVEQFKERVTGAAKLAAATKAA